MKAFSLFSGVGGFDLALRNTNHITIGACEIDQHARSIYRRQFPGVRIWDNATQIRPHEIPDFDILCAGFPCQSFSVAGQGRGFDDTRGTLFFEIARIAKEKKPSYLLLENVKGLLSNDKGKTFRRIIRTLDEMGYDAEWQVLNSKYFVPQNRERVFIIGYLRGKRRPKIFPLGDFIKEPTGKELKQIGNIDTKGHNSIWGRVYDPEGIASNLNAHGGGLGAKTGLYDVSKTKAMIFLAHSKGNIKTRIQNRDVSWTLLGNSGDFGVIEPPITADRSHDSRIRRLTPIECERLQGFPDNWTAGVSDSQRYKCLGNAVTVPVVEYILNNII